MNVVAQPTAIYHPRIKTLQVIVNNDALLPPIMSLGGHNQVEISFDDLTHEYHRYIYKIEHCNADWSVSQEVFENDYLSGFNGQPIEDYEKSFNTTQLYTHYSLRIPNNDVRLKLSGNYKVSIYCDEEDGEPDKPILTACFSLLEPKINITATVSSNTDIDFNRQHQQVSFALHYNNYTVIDPHRELKTLVMQNRRTDNCVITPKPNIQTVGAVEYTHNKNLIFPAGSEYHKFEILDIHQPTLNVDRIEWFDPYYHATLFEHKKQKNYTFDKDQDGGYIIRNESDEENETTSDYILVHFKLNSEPIPGGDVYVNGWWTYNLFSPEYKLTYNENARAYEGTMLIKQGYYNFHYMFVPQDSPKGELGPTDGNFYQTENEYIILVYHRPQGGRYDKLVGYRKINFSIDK